MAFLKFLRTFFQQIKSDLTPTQLAMGAFLGALAGLTPFGSHCILLFTVALLFNCSMATFLFAWATLKPAGLALGALSFRVGIWLLQDGGLWGSVIEGLSGAPILAYMGFERYVVAGGYALSLPLALALALAVRFGVAAYRKKLAPKLADAEWYRQAMRKKLFRFFLWVIAGREKEFKEPRRRFLLLRPFRAYMAILVPLLYAGLTLGAGLWAQRAVHGLAEGAASRALGVKVTFGKVEYSFFGQRFAFENFQLPDPSNTREDMVRIGGFEADLGFLSLLSKRFHVEKLAVRDVAVHVARREDGRLNVTEVPAAQPRDPAEKDAWNEWLGWLIQKGRETDWTEVWKKAQEYRKKGAEQAKREKPRVPGYDPDLRWEPVRKDPRFRVDHLEVKNLALRVSDRSGRSGGLPPLTSVEAKATGISTRPGWRGDPFTLLGAGLLDEGKVGKISFGMSYLAGRSTAEFRVEAVPLEEVRSVYEKSLPVKVEAGQATLRVDANVQAGVIDGGLNLRIDRLRVAPRSEEPRILGLDPETSGYAIQGINTYGESFPIVVGAGITGPLEDPAVHARMPFLEIAKKGLEMLGNKELQKYVDRLGGEAEALKKAGAEKLAPLEGDFREVQEETIKAIRTGDLYGVQEALQKTRADVKELPEAAKDLERKKEEAKGVLDLFRKRKKEEGKK